VTRALGLIQSKKLGMRGGRISEATSSPLKDQTEAVA
jgi:hypothetical protein